MLGVNNLDAFTKKDAKSIIRINSIPEHTLLCSKVSMITYSGKKFVVFTWDLNQPEDVLRSQDLVCDDFRIDALVLHLPVTL